MYQSFQDIMENEMKLLELNVISSSWLAPHFMWLPQRGLIMIINVPHYVCKHFGRQYTKAEYHNLASS